MIAWLIYLGIALGLHSFSLYIHNDTLSTFEREEDMFRDNGIQLKPILSIEPNRASVELGTGDFIVYHIKHLVEGYGRSVLSGTK